MNGKEQFACHALGPRIRRAPTRNAIAGRLPQACGASICLGALAHAQFFNRRLEDFHG
jgi:hypothetical protein